MPNYLLLGTRRDRLKGHDGGLCRIISDCTRRVVASSGRVLWCGSLSQRRPGCERGRVQARVKGKKQNVARRRERLLASHELPVKSVIGCIQRRFPSTSLAYPRDLRPRPHIAPLLQSAHVVPLYCQMTQVSPSLSVNTPRSFIALPLSPPKQSLFAIICPH